jgi:hypothetical protein
MSLSENEAGSYGFYGDAGSLIEQTKKRIEVAVPWKALRPSQVAALAEVTEERLRAIEARLAALEATP